MRKALAKGTVTGTYIHETDMLAGASLVQMHKAKGFA